MGQPVEQTFKRSMLDIVATNAWQDLEHEITRYHGLSMLRGAWLMTFGEPINEDVEFLISIYKDHLGWEQNRSAKNGK